MTDIPAPQTAVGPSGRPWRSQPPGFGGQGLERPSPPLRRSLSLGATPLRTAFIVLLLCLWEGIPFTLIGMTNVPGLQTFAICVLLGSGVFFYRVLYRGLRMTKWENISILMFAVCVSSSIAYSVFIRPQPLPAWAFAAYTATPVLSILAFRGLNCRLGDGVQAIYWSGFGASLFLLFETAFHTGLLDFYGRVSAFGTADRVVFFKLEAAFGLVIAMMNIIRAQRPWPTLGHILVATVISYNVFAASESRLAIFAVLAALFLSWLFVLRGSRKFLIAMIAPFFAIPVLWFVVGKFLVNFNGLEDYLVRDTSASWRRITIAHFNQYFSETHGLGFGFMSANPRYDNVLAFSSNRASELYGVPGYSVGLDDIGLYSALYQYGYLGIALTVIMTIMAIVALFRTRALGLLFAPVASIGVLMATFLLSPIPMNYFTLFYTAHMGGVLWFLAAEADSVRKGGARQSRTKAS